MAKSDRTASAASTEWDWCLTHDLSVPRGADDCGGGEVGMCEVVPSKPDAQMDDPATSPYDSLAFAAAAREEVGTMEEQLVEALRAIIAVPSERTLLYSAEARAMYEIAKRALEEVERRGS